MISGQTKTFVQNCKIYESWQHFQNTDCTGIPGKSHQWASQKGKFIGLTKADTSNKCGNSSIKHCGIVGYYTSASRGVLNHFADPRLGLPKVTKKHKLPVKTAPISPTVILICLSRGPKPHKLKTPTPKSPI